MGASVTPTNPNDPFKYVGQAQNLAKTGVEGFGQAAAPYLTRKIGTTLGDLNSIGGLRSGAVPVAMGDIATDYGNQVGAYAKMAAGESTGAGLAANEQDLMRQQIANQRKASLLGAIGSALGFGANFIPGGNLAKGAVKAVAGAVKGSGGSGGYGGGYDNSE